MALKRAIRPDMPDDEIPHSEMDHLVASFSPDEFNYVSGLGFLCGYAVTIDTCLTEGGRHEMQVTAQRRAQDGELVGDKFVETAIFTDDGEWVRDDSRTGKFVTTKSGKTSIRRLKHDTIMRTIATEVEEWAFTPAKFMIEADEPSETSEEEVEDGYSEEEVVEDEPAQDDDLIKAMQKSIETAEARMADAKGKST